MLPEKVLARLRQNLADNTARTAAMMAESASIHRSFQKAGLSYATLKGFSLWPLSVPVPELRSQLDLDFLVDEYSAAEARRILELRGYRLHAIGGRTWEFKAGQMPSVSLDDLYKPTPLRTVELHIEPAAAPSTLLRGAEMRRFYDLWMPVLAPTDLFLGQALHLFKHVCSEYSRTAHLLEFRRHVMVRCDDAAFWCAVKLRAEADPRAPIALGVITLLVTQLMGAFAPKELTNWTVDRLPPAARLWIDTWGHAVVLADFPGTKLYLLLQEAIAPEGITAQRSLRQSLLPSKLPPAIAHAEPDENLTSRMRRNWRQLGFIFFRLRFHLVEGFRYLYACRRWRKSLRRIAS